MTDQRPPLNAERAFHALEDAAEKYCNAQFKYRSLEEAKKPLLARLASQSDATSVAAAEREALSSNEYKEFIGGLVEAEKEALRAKLAYGNLEQFARLRQTEESTRRTLTK